MVFCDFLSFGWRLVDGLEDSLPHVLLLFFGEEECRGLQERRGWGCFVGLDFIEANLSSFIACFKEVLKAEVG